MLDGMVEVIVEVTPLPPMAKETTLKEAKEGFDYTIVYHDGHTTLICTLHPCVTGVFSSLKAFANHAYWKHQWVCKAIPNPPKWRS